MHGDRVMQDEVNSLNARVAWLERKMLEDFVPTIPDWANDQHTLAGRKMGRGLDHFRKEGAKLVPPPTADDPYEDEAYRLWQIKQQGK